MATCSPRVDQLLTLRPGRERQLQPWVDDLCASVVLQEEIACWGVDELQEGFLVRKDNLRRTLKRISSLRDSLICWNWMGVLVVCQVNFEEQ